jgi:hypothetical protein
MARRAEQGMVSRSTATGQLQISSLGIEVLPMLLARADEVIE